jgi:Suppressor of fused protein (SUFU)
MKAERLLCHLEKYLGPFSEKMDFENEEGFKLQILVFTKVFGDASVGYSTYGAGGLINYSKGVQIQELEIVVLTKHRFDELGASLALATFFIAANNESVRPGYCTDPFLRISTPTSKPFVSLYFCTPAVFDKDFWRLSVDGSSIHFLIAFPIFLSECKYVKKEGPDDFEKLLSQKGVDFMDYERKPLFEDVNDYSSTIQ